MKISDVLESEENIKAFYEKVIKAWDLGDLTPNQWKDIMGIGLEKALIRWMAKNTYELVDLGIFDYSSDACEKIDSISPRKIAEEYYTGKFDGIIKKLREKYAKEY